MNAMTPPRVATLAMILVALGCGQSPPAKSPSAKPAKEKTAAASRKNEKTPVANAEPAKATQRVKPDAMLRQRAQAFLKKPIPVAVEYDPSSIAERVIREYADHGTVELDGVSVEVLEAQIRAARASADANDGPQAAYYRELAEVLDAILHNRQPSSSK
jgi:hypothetical protein